MIVRTDSKGYYSKFITCDNKIYDKKTSGDDGSFFFGANFVPKNKLWKMKVDWIYRYTTIVFVRLGCPEIFPLKTC